MNIKTGPRSRAQVYSQAVTSTITLQRGPIIALVSTHLRPTVAIAPSVLIDDDENERDITPTNQPVTHFFEVTLSGPLPLPLTVEVAIIGGKNLNATLQPGWRAHSN